MQRRQFVFLMTDTTRFDMLGCYGTPGMHTPNLDRMAEEGLRFERAYTTQPVCGPARSALFTGQYPHQNGSWGNTLPLYADAKTLGQYLSPQGIRCAYIGKWHLDGGDYFGNGVCPEGWDADYWYDMKCYLDELSDEDKVRSRKKQTALEGEGIDASFTYGHRVTERALDFISRYADEDFFLVVSYDEPHGPYLCPPEYAHLFDGYTWPQSPAHTDTLEDKPLYQRVWSGDRRLKDRAQERYAPGSFFGCNAFADSEIGRVLGALREHAPGANALYTSDHGEAMDEHCLLGKGPSVYDCITRIPLILRGPSVSRGVYPHTVSHIDLPATVLDLLGMAAPRAFAGQSLRPVLEDPSQPTGRPAYITYGRYEVDHDAFGGFQPMRAILTDDYKLAVNLTDTDELYDVAADPYDTRNLIDDPAHAATRNALHDALIAFMNDTRDPFRGYQWQARPWRQDILPNWRVNGYTRQRENEPGEYRQRIYETGLTMEEAVRKM